MDKVRKALADLKGINTNDPVMQSRVVKVLEAMLVSLENKQDRIDPSTLPVIGSDPKRVGHEEDNMANEGGPL